MQFNQVGGEPHLFAGMDYQYTATVILEEEWKDVEAIARPFQ